MQSSAKKAKRSKFALMCIFATFAVSVFFLYPKSSTELLNRKESVRNDFSANTKDRQLPVNEGRRSTLSANKLKDGSKDEQIDSLIARSKIESKGCQKKLQSLQEKFNSSKNSSVVDMLIELRSIPGMPPSSAVIFERTKQNGAEPWKFGTDVHQIGDCNPSLRANLLKDIINRAAMLDTKGQKTVVSLVIDDLRAVSSQPAPSLMQLSSASTLSTLQQSGLLGKDLSLSAEVAIIRDEYRSFSNSVSTQEDSFKVTQLEMDYSERARGRILSILEARFPTR